jgi:hypothetical protein
VTMPWPPFCVPTNAAVIWLCGRQLIQRVLRHRQAAALEGMAIDPKPTRARHVIESRAAATCADATLDSAPPEDSDTAGNDPPRSALTQRSLRSHQRQLAVIMAAIAAGQTDMRDILAAVTPGAASRCCPSGPPRS